MSHPSNIGSSKVNNPKDETAMPGATGVRKDDLVELLLKPLAAQIDRVRLELIVRVEKLNDSTDMIARQMRRSLDRPKGNENRTGGGLHEQGTSAT